MTEGTSTRVNNLGFWTFNLGHLLTILGLVGGFMWWFVSYDRDINATKVNTANLAAAVERLAKHVEEMDSHGTQASQHGIFAESEFNKATEKRVQVLEAEITALTPKVERIDVNMNWVVDWIKTHNK